MENHRKIYKSSSEDVSKHIETKTVAERPGKAGLTLRRELRKISHEAADARPFLNMANARPAQGTKRHLSLSPLKTIDEENITEMNPEGPYTEMEVHLSKKRLVSCQEIVNLQTVRAETGNDPHSGHGQGGSAAVEQLPRTKSKMAAPMIKTKQVYSQINQAKKTAVTGDSCKEKLSNNHEDQDLNVSQTDSIILEDFSPSNSQNDAMIDLITNVGDTNLWTDLIADVGDNSLFVGNVPHPCPITKTITRPDPSNTTIDDAVSPGPCPCPSNMTVREATHATTKTCSLTPETTATATTNKSTTTRGETTYPSNTTVGHPPTMTLREVITTTNGEPACPSNTTVGEASTSSTTTQYEALNRANGEANHLEPGTKAKPCPSNTTVGEAPSSEINVPSNHPGPGTKVQPWPFSTTAGGAPYMVPCLPNMTIEKADVYKKAQPCPFNTTVMEALSITCPSNTTVGEAPSLRCPSNTTVGEAPSLRCPSNTTVGEAPSTPCPSDETVGEAPSLRCPSNTTVGEAPSLRCPSNMTVGEAPSLRCPSNTTVGEAPSTPCPSNTTVGEAPSTPCPSDMTVGEAPSTPCPSNTTVGEAPSMMSKTIGGVSPTSPSDIIPPIKPSSSESPYQANPKKSRLRPRSKVVAFKTKTTPCSDCSACKETTNSRKSIPTKQTEPKKSAQHPPRGRGRPRKVQNSKTLCPAQKSKTLSPAQKSSGLAQKKSTDTTVKDSSRDKPQDLFGVLIEIKNELGEVKEKQESCHDDLCEIMDTKMSDFKQSLGIEINSIKQNVGKNTTVLTHLQTDLEDQLRVSESTKAEVNLNKTEISDLKNDVMQNKTEIEQSKTMLADLKVSQDTAQCKVENLDVKLTELRQQTDGIELEVIRQKKNHNKLSLSMSTHVSEVEHDLAHHIDVVKTNMEEEVSVTKQNQRLLENKLANFTEEIIDQNSNLNEKIHHLQKDFEQLKTLTENVNSGSGYSSSFLLGSNSNSNSNPNSNSNSNPDSSPNLSFNSQTNSDTINSSTNGSYGSFSLHHPQHQNQNVAGASRFNSCDPSYPQNDSSFYMYGDTSRSIILDGIREDQNEILRDIANHCINDMGIPITQADIENVFRIGKFDRNRSRPRPVKLVLADQTVRDQIFLFKARLRFSEIYRDVRINKEEPKDIRIRIAKLRQAGQSARKQGHRVETKPGEIIIDGMSFNISNLDDIPQKFMTEANKSKSPPQNINRMSLSRRCRTKSNATIMVGPSLQKTPRGLAFYSHQSFLSNFHSCKICFRNQTFTCLEQGYQCTKAELCDDWEAYDEILNMTSQVDMKRAGARIVTTAFWEAHKVEVMEDLIFCKFRQNKKLYYSLLNTRPLKLIEATTDDFWGAGCIFGSIALMDGSWEGKNNLGKLLVRVRDFFVKELEIGQGSIQ